MNNKLLYHTDYVSDKSVCSMPDKQSFKCELYKDGKLISGIHSLQGTEQRAGTITVRTSADDPDPVRTSTGGSGTTKSRSKQFGDKQGY